MIVVGPVSFLNESNSNNFIIMRSDTDSKQTETLIFFFPFFVIYSLLIFIYFRLTPDIQTFRGYHLERNKFEFVANLTIFFAHFLIAGNPLSKTIIFFLCNWSRMQGISKCNIFVSVNLKLSLPKEITITMYGVRPLELFFHWLQ